MATKNHKPSEWQSNLIKLYKIKSPNFKGVIAARDDSSPSFHVGLLEPVVNDNTCLKYALGNESRITEIEDLPEVTVPQNSGSK